MKRIIATIAIAAAVSLTALRADEKETPVKLASLPEALQKAIKAAAGAGKIKSVVTEVDGKETNYEVVVVNGKQKLEHKFSLAGKLLETEEEVALADLPGAVRATIEKHAAGSKILEVAKVTMDGKNFYEAEIKTAKGKEEVRVSLKGKVLGTETEQDEAKEDAKK